MSQMDRLLAQLCPKGVEFKEIGSIAELVRGNGMPKSDFVEAGVGCIHYGQIYTYYGIWATETKSFVPAEKAAKLAKVQPGDLIVTNTSENMVDVCKAVAWLGEEEIVTGGHATVLKHSQDPKYLSYYLQTPQFFADKKRHATGTKVIDVSAKSLAKIRIPVPPLEIQREIVAILDRFTKLEAELEAELEARRRQYQHYRDTLLNFADGLEVPWMPMGEVAEIRSGWGFPNKFQGKTIGMYPFYKVSDMNLVGNETMMTKSNNFVDEDDAKKLGVKVAPPGTVIFPKIGAAVATNKKRLLTRPSAYDNNVMGLIPGGKLLSRFLFYWMQTVNLGSLAHDSGAVPSIRKSEMEHLQVPGPPLDEQERIVAILDKFDALVNDLSSGLPAEISARRRQYEYYRDRLMTFQEAA
jgi:type I restriction enzyme, S subunit